MGIIKIFKDGISEIKRKSRLRKVKKDISGKEKEHTEKLVSLGAKAWESKLDMSNFGKLNEKIAKTHWDS